MIPAAAIRVNSPDVDLIMERSATDSRVTLSRGKYFYRNLIGGELLDPCDSGVPDIMNVFCHFDEATIAQTGRNRL
ncbi:hypothetical protein OKW39_008612 [Paraburkholderia sp. MM6662-R1]